MITLIMIELFVYTGYRRSDPLQESDKTFDFIHFHTCALSDGLAKTKVRTRRAATHIFSGRNTLERK